MYLWIPKHDRCASLSARPQTGSRRPSAPSPVTRNQVQLHPPLDPRTPPLSMCPLRLPTPRLEHPNAHDARICLYRSPSVARRCSLHLHPVQILGISRHNHSHANNDIGRCYLNLLFQRRRVEHATPVCPRDKIQPAPPQCGALPAQVRCMGQHPTPLYAPDLVVLKT